MIALLLAAALTNCPTPKPLTCDQLKAKMAQRCQPEPEKPCPVLVPTPPPPCPACPAPQVKEKVIEVPTIILRDAPMPKPEGHWLVGGGPIYKNRFGLTAVGGYQFPGHWQVLAGPIYLPDQNHDGNTYGCGRPPERDGPNALPSWPQVCITEGYHVEQSSPWGVQALVVYRFGGK